MPSWFQKPTKPPATTKRDGASGDGGASKDKLDDDALFDDDDSHASSEHGTHVSISTLRTSSRQRLHSLIALAVGAGAMHRSQALDINGQSQPRDANSNTAAELSLAASFYPFALLTRSVMRDIGVGLGFTRAIGADVPMASGETFSLKAMQFVADLRWRWRSSTRPTALRIKAVLGWGTRIATATPLDILSLSYSFMRVGGSATLPLGTQWFALSAGFELRPLLSVGQEATDALGDWSGGFGFAARAGIGGEHRSGFYYRVCFEAERYTSSFAGLDPATSAPRPNSGDTVDPSQSSDTFLRLRAMVGFAL